MTLADPAWLLLLLALPLLLLLRGRRGPGPAVAFSRMDLLRAAAAKVPQPRLGGLRLPAAALCLLCGAVALSRPQKVKSFESAKASGIEIILAIDISMSMNIEDFSIGGNRVNRLTAAKQVVRQFVEGRPSDRIGVVAFAGRPYVPSPPTLDHDWLQDAIGKLQLGVVEDGTAIGSALAASAKRLDRREAESKIIVLLTDGVNNSGDLTPETAAELAHTLGIKIYTIAVGTPGVHPIRDPRTGMVRAMQSEFDEETLQKIAALSDGQFYRANDMDNFEKIFREIDDLEKTEMETLKTVEAEDLFPWFVGASLAFGALSCVFRK
ncbi:MAG: VWA domain-containing protein [Verrucomicrobiales bacterium]